MPGLKIVSIHQCSVGGREGLGGLEVFLFLVEWLGKNDKGSLNDPNNLEGCQRVYLNGFCWRFI